MMPVDVEQEQMWTLADDRRTVRLNLPPLPLAGLAQPLNVHLDFDSKAIEEMIDRLTMLRAKMLPASPRRGERN
jgi:hypothetical protein